MGRQVGKIITLPAKRRHIRGRILSNGEVIRRVAAMRSTNDDGPRAA